jgi:hypothetical protein
MAFADVGSFIIKPANSSSSSSGALNFFPKKGNLISVLSLLKLSTLFLGLATHLDRTGWYEKYMYERKINPKTLTVREDFFSIGKTLY